MLSNTLPCDGQLNPRMHGSFGFKRKEEIEIVLPDSTIVVLYAKDLCPSNFTNRVVASRGRSDTPLNQSWRRRHLQGNHPSLLEHE